MMRILFLGENWYGSCARACCYALRRLGCDVRDVDIQTFFPQLRRLGSRMILRLLQGRFVSEYNEAILDLAASYRPDALLAFKGQYVLKKTLDVLRAGKVSLYNYYPDTSAFCHGKYLWESLSIYDCVFYTKPFWEKDVRVRIPLRRAVFLPHGYDREVHHPWELDEKDLEQWTCDVSLIATHTAHKESVLSGLIEANPDIDLRIWGSGWRERCRTAGLRKCVRGPALTGASYAKALQAARVNLAVMSGEVPGASQSDGTTTRSYEIPACGGFMLHERTKEILDIYSEGKEIACFGSVEELARKIDYYLARAEERQSIARAGHSRCVPAYSYDNRMAQLLKWHAESTGT